MGRSAHAKPAPVEEIDSENKIVLRMARRLAATIGADFFAAIDRHLAEALAADCVLIGEFVGGPEERCRSVAAWLDGKPAQLDYALAESATAPVVLGKATVCRSHAQARFPSDELMKKVGAEACVAIPLTNGGGAAIGVLMAVFRERMTSARLAIALLEIFAQRAAAELAHKQEEERLRESEQRYRAFIARNHDAMWRVEFPSPIPTDLPPETQYQRIYETGYLAECNDAMASLVGRKKGEELIGCTLAEIAPQTDASVREATIAAIRSGYTATTFETNWLDVAGIRRHMVRSQWAIVENGKLERIWGSTRDVSEVWEAETALDASEQRMADLLEAMRLLVIMLDPHGAIAYCNRYFYRLTGWSSLEIVGKEWVDRLIPEEERSRIQAELARGAVNAEAPAHFECVLVGQAGQQWQIAWDSTVLRGPNGEIAARALIGRDVTELHALEEQLRQAHKLAGIGRLAGSVAHDFNNLLTVILGNVGALLDRSRPADSSYSPLSDIRKAAERGADLSRRLLTFGRRQAFRLQVAPLNTLVEDMAAMIGTAIGKEVRLMMNLDPDAGSVRLDATYFHQVLLNLAINARDAMPRGGTLAIATANVEIAGKPGMAEPAGPPPGSYVQLTVADTGSGITPEVRDHLFEPFFSTKEPGKGAGLGLSTVYGIVTQSGGHILVDTQVGHGTIFRIYLPRVEQEAEQRTTEEVSSLPRGAETILLLDDRPDVRKLATDIMLDLGYTVLPADGPVRALELCREHSGTIHLLAVNMKGSDLPAEELADLIKEIRPEIKVLFLSGSAEARSLERTSEHGWYLPKRFTPRTLANKLREVLDRK